MKKINILLLAIGLFTINNSYAKINASNLISLHKHDANFTVTVKNGDQPVKGASVEIYVTGRKDAKIKTTKENGELNFTIKDYKHEKVSILVRSNDYTPIILRDLDIKNGATYNLNFKTSEKLIPVEETIETEEEVIEIQEETKEIKEKTEEIKKQQAEIAKKAKENEQAALKLREEKEKADKKELNWKKKEIKVKKLQKN